eukprot:XP_001704691.1 Hypothetical protein GL50803_39419 [Giardia lamblia ATCC 50803]
MHHPVTSPQQVVVPVQPYDTLYALRCRPQLIHWETDV